MGKLEGKVAIITGAASGIGKGILEVFVEEGAKAVFCDLQEEKGLALQNKLREEGYDVTFIKANVGKHEEIKNLIQFAVDTYGQLDILVNNAGIMYTVALPEITEEQIDNTYNVNLKGYFLAMKYAVQVMKPGSAIVNIASCGGIISGYLATAYGSSKAGVIHLSRVAAREMAPKGIRINSISPGTFITEMMPADSEYTKACASACPMGRAGDPKELGKAAAFLASDEASYISGINLPVDGATIS